MKQNKMKVFHGLVNYGTQAGVFAKELRRQGINAISVVNADPLKRVVDINIRYDLNQKSIIVRAFQRFWIKFSSFFKYNVFHFYYAKSLWPWNIDMPLYKLFGKKVVMEYLGTDIDLWLGYNGVDWRGRPVNRVKLVRRVYRQAKLVHKQLACTPRYHEFVDNSIIVPLALDLTDYSFHPLPSSLKEGEKVLTIMHAPTNRQGKKSDFIEAALDRLKKEGYKFNYKCVTNVTHAQLKEEYIKADIVVDQLNRWYGTVSVEAMALGRPVVCGFQTHLCSYDKRYKNLPIINADIYNIYDVLKDILDDKYDLEAISKASRDFAMRVHDVRSVTKQLIDIYESL